MVLFLPVIHAGVNPAQPALLPIPQSVQWGGQAIALVPMKIRMPSVSELNKDKVRSNMLFQEVRKFKLAHHFNENLKSEFFFYREIGIGRGSGSLGGAKG